MKPFLVAMTRCLGILALESAAIAGPHEGGCYVDPCQSMDGRYVVVAKRIEGKKQVGGAMVDHEWRFSWKDTQTGQTHEGKLIGLRSGIGFGHQVHGHIFVPPGGATFAVWNARGYNPNPTNASAGVPGAKWPDLAFKNHVNFDNRLVIYAKTGEVLRSLALKDLLDDAEWEGVWPAASQAYWAKELHAKNRGGYHNLPRSDYAFYKVSPDYSVLEFVVSPWWEGKLHKKLVEDKSPIPERTVRVSLIDGKKLSSAEKAIDPNQIPIRPFVGEFPNVNRQKQADFIPSFDPVRVAGRFPNAH